MINHITRFLLLFLLAITFLQQNKVYAWGWETHRYINNNAVDYLPSEMDFFKITEITSVSIQLIQT